MPFVTQWHWRIQQNLPFLEQESKKRKAKGKKIIRINFLDFCSLLQVKFFFFYKQWMEPRFDISFKKSEMTFLLKRRCLAQISVENCLAGKESLEWLVSGAITPDYWKSCFLESNKRCWRKLIEKAFGYSGYPIDDREK